MQMDAGERTPLFPLCVKSFYLNLNAITEKNTFVLVLIFYMAALEVKKSCLI